MVTFEKIKNVLSDTSIDELTNQYIARQKANILENKVAIETFLKDLNMDISIFDTGDAADTFRNIIAYAQKTGNKSLIDFLNSTLQNHKYKDNGELMLFIYYLDRFFEKEIFFSELIDSKYPYPIITSVKKNGDDVFVTTTKCDISFSQALSKVYLPKKDKIERRGYCHHMTSYALECYPNLYGGYFYIPMDFQGTFEHSVIIDPEKNMVYDFANNVALPYPIFENFFSKPTFTIKGSELNLLRNQVQDTYGEDFYMHHIEEVRRRVK